MEGMLTEMLVYLSPLWTAFAFLVGIIFGWAWKPRWANKKTQKLTCVVSKSVVSPLQSSPSNSSKTSPMSPLRSFGSAPCLNALELLHPRACESWVTNNIEPKPHSVISLSDNCTRYVLGFILSLFFCNLNYCYFLDVQSFQFYAELDVSLIKQS